MKRLAATALSLLVMTALSVPAAEAQRTVRGAAAGPNGAAAAQAHSRQGPEGGRIAGARGVATDRQGNAVAGGVNCASGAAGAACRAGATTRAADGSLTHKGGIVAQGANGETLTSRGELTRDADGNVVAARNTQASGQNGSVNIDSGYTTAGGGTRTVTCMDVNGAVVPCPQR